MSKRQLKADDVDGFMMAVWDSFADLAADFDVAIGVGVVPSKLRGHIYFRAKAYQKGADGVERAVATAEVVWPTHYAQTVHALLYGLLVRLWRALDTWKLESGEDGCPPTNVDRAKDD